MMAKLSPLHKLSRPNGRQRPVLTNLNWIQSGVFEMRVCGLSVASIFAVLLTSMGCSGKPGRLDPPDIPADAGEQAVAKYDADGSGSIDGAELTKVPALKATLGRVDKNNDGRVTAEEINQRIDSWRHSKTALMRFVVNIRRDGSPLEGATVTLVPESFLGTALKTAKGTTRGNGSANVEISRNPDESGVQLGYYRIEVTKPDQSGKELLPARFNTDTELGAEICRDDASADNLTLHLNGK
jgi:hypothetical protein